MTTWLTLREQDQTTFITLQGHWRTQNLPELTQRIHTLATRNCTRLVVNGSNLNSIDTSGALCLRKIAEKLGSPTLEFQDLSESHQSLIELILAAPNYPPPESAFSLREVIEGLGCRVESALSGTYGLVGFFGKVCLELLAIPFRLRKFRFREFIVQFDRALLQAIPVISLVTLLIGVVVAYLFATQIEKYGANILIVDSVALAMGRELSPLIVATVVAGRSGSAFTAQIGSMILTQEIDAIETMGLRTLDVLVIPRILALILAVPALVLLGDIVSIYGGSLIAHHQLNITPVSFLERLNQIKPQHFISGLIKAPFFALCIAVIGCKMGLSVENNARSVGLHTTSTVVQSIVAVILIDAVFAVIFMQLMY